MDDITSLEEAFNNLSTHELRILKKVNNVIKEYAPKGKINWFLEKSHNDFLFRIAKIQSHLFNHGILITCFATDIEGKVWFRFYFKDLKSKFIYNPIEKLNSGKIRYPLYENYDIGLIEMLKKASEYLNQKNKEVKP